MALPEFERLNVSGEHLQRLRTIHECATAYGFSLDYPAEDYALWYSGPHGRFASNGTCTFIAQLHNPDYTDEWYVRYNFARFGEHEADAPRRHRYIISAPVDENLHQTTGVAARACALNNIPVETIEQLTAIAQVAATSEAVTVRYDAASFRWTPPDALHTLSMDEYESVRKAVARNRWAPKRARTLASL